MKDPANLRGTGPWMIKEYREGVSFTLQKNPDYWGYDELFPDHKFQLPYADEFKKVFIDDMSLRLAALRTGKLDVLDNLHMGDRGISWEDKESLDKSTPDLKYVAFEMTGCGLVFRYDKKPFFLTSGCAKRCRWPSIVRRLTGPGAVAFRSRYLRWGTSCVLIVSRLLHAV